ncbi:MAG TPA: glycosyltransferase family 39 protein [Vicinamibacterales bacterium]
MIVSTAVPECSRTNPAALAPVAAAVAALHLLAINDYGIFRDELYYLACGRHLAWGYVDHPPAVAVMARASSLLGDSLVAIRILPILLSCALVFIVGAIVRRLGGGRFAQALAALLVALAPHFLFTFHVLSMNSAEVTLWALGSWLVLVAVQSGRAWPWVALGATIGFGLLTKHSAVVFGLGLFAGLLLTPARQALRTPWPWIGAALAALVAAPHVAWQVANGWPTVEFVRNAQEFKIAEQSLASFSGEIVGMMGPVTLPLWAAGLWWLLRGRAATGGRVLAVCAIVVVLVFLLQRSKPYYATAVWPVLFAAGAVALERSTENLRRWRYAATAILLLIAAAVAPMGLPVLPIQTHIAYAAALGVRPSSQERQELGVLPQHFADMYGREELAHTISSVYQSLPAEEKASARVFARNYGEAGALEYYARRYPLPRVISPHNSYWFWGPGPDGGTLIIIGGDREDNARVFERFDEVDRTRCTYCMPYENGRPIGIGRGWKIPLSQLWPTEKDFI